jgi:N-acetylneuraminate lyase
MNKNLKEGASGFFVGGSSGECFLLTEEERIAGLEAASEFKNKSSLIAHIGAISTDQAIRLGKAAKRFGFHHLAATPPFYYGFSPDAIAQYYHDIYKAVGMPLMVYNFPAATNKPFNLDLPVNQELFRSDSVWGIKHTNLDLFQLERIKHISPKLVLMNGFDETMVAGLALGAVGSIGCTFNFMLPHFVKIWDNYVSGRREEALALQIKANTVMSSLCRVALVPAVKYICKKQGIDVGDPRRPFRPLTLEQQKFVDGVLREDLCN